MCFGASLRAEGEVDNCRKPVGLNHPTKLLAVTPLPESGQPATDARGDPYAVAAQEGDEVRNRRHQMLGRHTRAGQLLHGNLKFAGCHLPAGELLNELVAIHLTVSSEGGNPLPTGGPGRQVRGQETLADGRPGGLGREAQVEHPLDGRGLVVPPGQAEGGQHRNRLAADGTEEPLDADGSGMRGIDRVSGVATVADEAGEGLTVRAGSRPGDGQVSELASVVLDVGAELCDNHHVGVGACSEALRETVLAAGLAPFLLDDGPMLTPTAYLLNSPLPILPKSDP